MTDLPTRRQIHDSIAEKFASAPANADANGKTDLDRAQDAATVAKLMGPPEPTVDIASDLLDTPTGPPPALKPNRAQGSSSATPATPPGSGDSVLDRMRANARQALDL